MGNFSPYSEEWEKQHMNKVITRAMEEYAQRKAAFEKLPKPIQLLIIAGEKTSYYVDIAYIQIRKCVDRKYREAMEAGTAELKAKIEAAINDSSNPQSF